MNWYRQCRSIEIQCFFKNECWKKIFIVFTLIEHFQTTTPAEFENFEKLLKENRFTMIVDGLNLLYGIDRFSTDPIRSMTKVENKIEKFSFETRQKYFLLLRRSISWKIFASNRNKCCSSLGNTSARESQANCSANWTRFVNHSSSKTRSDKTTFPLRNENKICRFFICFKFAGRLVHFVRCNSTSSLRFNFRHSAKRTRNYQ